MTPAKRAAVVGLVAALAIPFEGLRQFAYHDPPGILTVCYGHTGPDVQKGRRYTLAECKALLERDMATAIDAVERCRPGLPERVHAAFADAVYNLGPTIVCDRRNSTAARLLAEGDLAGACMQLPRWAKARVGGQMVELPGLVKRRAAERDLCLEGARP